MCLSLCFRVLGRRAGGRVCLREEGGSERLHWVAWGLFLLLHWCLTVDKGRLRMSGWNGDSGGEWRCGLAVG